MQRQPCVRLPRIFILLWLPTMDDGGFTQALSRAEQAIARIEQSLASGSARRGRDDQLRAKVRDAISELDQLIQSAGA